MNLCADAPCATLIACALTSSRALARELAAAARVLPDILEFRTDALPLRLLSEVLDFAEERGMEVLLTLKKSARMSAPDILAELGARSAHGGCRVEQFDRAAAQPMSPLEQPDRAAALFGRIRYVDIELDDAETLCAESGNPDKNSALSALTNFLERGAELIVSYHDYEMSDRYSASYPLGSAECRTHPPGECPALSALFERFRALEPLLGVSIIPKIAVTPSSVEAGRGFIKNIKQIFLPSDFGGGFERLICIPMGEQCADLRRCAGGISCIAYAYLLTPNAPGQLSVSAQRAF